MKGGLVLLLPADWLINSNRSASDVLFSFAIGSDLHYGQPETTYEKNLEEFAAAINRIHAARPLSFCFVNGDLVHDDISHFPAVKKGLGELKMKYYVSQGNHDHANEAQWKNAWNLPLNFTYELHDYGFIAATTSDERGEYKCPDLKFLADSLKKYESKKGVFVFLHINTSKLKNASIDCPEILEVLKAGKNLIGVFNGHDHDVDAVLDKEGVKFLFDGHIGGNWGLKYHGSRVVEVRKDGTIVTYIMKDGVAERNTDLR
jgi:hypothetical protein